MNNEDSNQIREILRKEIGGVEIHVREDPRNSLAISRRSGALTAWTSALTASSTAWNGWNTITSVYPKSLTDAQRLDSATAATLAAQQRAIDDLYRHVAGIKRNLPPQR